MESIDVEGVTGNVHTNYKGKAEAALAALETHDFVYLHVEAIDECSHMGDLKLKLQAIEEFDKYIVSPVLKALENRDDVNVAVLPDHPVPIKLRQHTTTPVPVAAAGPDFAQDEITSYNEKQDEVEQSERSEVFGFIVNELQEVADILPNEHSNKMGNYYGRVTVPVVHFLLAKLALNAEIYCDDNWTDGVPRNGKEIFFTVDGESTFAYSVSNRTNDNTLIIVTIFEAFHIVEAEQ